MTAGVTRKADEKTSRRVALLTEIALDCCGGGSPIREALMFPLTPHAGAARPAQNGREDNDKEK